MGKSFSLWKRMSNTVSDPDIESGGSTTFGSKLKGFQSQYDQQQQLQQQQIELAIQDSQSCLSLKKEIESLEMEIEMLKQEIQVWTEQEKLEKERKQKDLQQFKLQVQEQLAQLQLQNRFAQPQLLDQHRLETSEEQHITLQNFPYMPDLENPFPPTDLVVVPQILQTQQRNVLYPPQTAESGSGSLSNKFFGILNKIKDWMCCCNMVVGEGVVNRGYQWVKRIVCNLKDWVSKVVCCYGVVVRGRIKTGKVELVTVVGGAIAFLVFENLVYSMTWEILTKNTQLGAHVQKSWIIHMVVGFGALVSTGLIGVCTVLWTIMWFLKLLGQYAEEAAQGGNGEEAAQGGNVVESDSSDSTDKDD